MFARESFRVNKSNCQMTFNFCVCTLLKLTVACGITVCNTLQRESEKERKREERNRTRKKEGRVSEQEKVGKPGGGGTQRSKVYPQI